MSIYLCKDIHAVQRPDMQFRPIFSRNATKSRSVSSFDGLHVHVRQAKTNFSIQKLQHYTLFSASTARKFSSVFAVAYLKVLQDTKHLAALISVIEFVCSLSISHCPTIYTGFQVPDYHSNGNSQAATQTATRSISRSIHFPISFFA